ncbi:MAG: ABC transporter ATP-binding protein [Planctomycetota bacterium]|jgi:ABC-2 type transport system ATP-binding protein
MIVATRLTRTFGRLIAVDHIDFEIGAGRVVGFLGPNGAGKTTTIRMIAGFLPPTSGEVRVDGLRTVEHPLAVSRRIGYLPESAPLYTEMRVDEYLHFRGRLYGLPRTRRRAAVDRVAESCWLADVRRRPIHQLSKGFRQRVGLAAAMLHEPPVLILDEPTVGLDPTQIRAVRSLIRELAGRHTILLSTHILSEVEMTCDEILMIARGRIRLSGPVSDLRDAVARTSPRYVVETTCRRPEKDLRTIVGVRDARTADLEDGWSRTVIEAKPDAPDLRESIAAAIVRQEGRVRELHREVPSLEQLFEQVIAGDAPEREPAAAEVPA